jgi:hypothetical protein
VRPEYPISGRMGFSAQNRARGGKCDRTRFCSRAVGIAWGRRGGCARVGVEVVEVAGVMVMMHPSMPEGMVEETGTGFVPDWRIIGEQDF